MLDNSPTGRMPVKRKTKTAMKRVTIYVPDDGQLPYMSASDHKREGLSTAQVIGALTAAMMQVETSVRMAVEKSFRDEEDKQTEQK